ncbi:MAG: DUF983 domain-containing protein [Ancalomicrobiaceae bacterium]|nr:DUF983 domain-containing protein [Ancalomicrobiaceae bacterium]
MSPAEKPSTPPANSNVPPIVAGALGRCPRCGGAKLFSGYLHLAPKCEACGLDYGFIDAGDGPAVFVILIVGFVVMAAALVTEVKLHPPIWLHMVLWLPLVVVLALGLLRPLKGILIALQFTHKAREGRLEKGDPQ